MTKRGVAIVCTLLACILLAMPVLASCSANDPNTEDWYQKGDLYIWKDGAWQTVSGGSTGDMAKVDYDPNDDQVIAAAQLDTGITLTDGSRPFTNPVGGVDPVADTDLETKGHTDASIKAATWEYYMDSSMDLVEPYSDTETSVDFGAIGGLGGSDSIDWSLDTPEFRTFQAGTYLVHFEAEWIAGTQGFWLYAELLGYQLSFPDPIETYIGSSEAIDCDTLTSRTVVNLNIQVGPAVTIPDTASLVLRLTALEKFGGGTDSTLRIYLFGNVASRVSAKGAVQVGSGGGAGDMTKAQYDTNDNGVVDSVDSGAIVWHGAYDNAHAYVVNDAVSYQGSSYICIQNSTGHLPTDTNYWDLMASKGESAFQLRRFVDGTFGGSLVSIQSARSSSVRDSGSLALGISRDITVN